jgi:predicted O-methyltransferase YrrM
MHCQKELLEDLLNHDFISDSVLLKWFNDSYSVSKHLLTLYSIARGLQANIIIEIGFGRSSFVLAKAAKENNGIFITCDTTDFSQLLSKEEKEVTQFIHNTSDKLWEYPLIQEQGIDFAFLDYFSSETLTPKFCKDEIYKCFNLLKENGIIAIHDTYTAKYTITKAIKLLDIKHFTLGYNYGLTLIQQIQPTKYGKCKSHWIKKLDTG